MFPAIYLVPQSADLSIYSFSLPSDNKQCPKTSVSSLDSRKIDVKLITVSNSDHECLMVDGITKAVLIMTSTNLKFHLTTAKFWKRGVVDTDRMAICWEPFFNQTNNLGLWNLNPIVRDSLLAIISSFTSIMRVPSTAILQHSMRDSTKKLLSKTYTCGASKLPRQVP